MASEIPEIEPPKQRKFIKQPDVEQKNKKIDKLNDDIKKIEASITLISTQIESTATPKADAEKRKTLTAELRKIVSFQDDIKKKRHNINDQVRLIDQNIKKKISEINAKTSKYNFKTVEDIDNNIRKIENSIESGNLMLVEEKKALKEITALNKLKKDFAGIELTQKSVDSDKAKIAELKASLSGITNKEVQTQFESITKELDELSEKNKSIQTKRDELFNKRRALQNEKYEHLKEIRKIRDDFDAKFKRFKSDMDNERKKREEEEKAYRLYLERKDLLEEIQQLESSAKVPAFTEEISQVKAAISSLDPTIKFEEEKVSALDTLGSSSLDKISTKVSEIQLPEDAEIIKKEEETFFAPTVKSKKGKKNNNKKKQNKTIDSHVVTQLTVIGVNVPATQEDIPKVVEQLQEKLEEYKKNQVDANKKNEEQASEKIAKIKETIADLDKQILAELAKEKERANAGSETPEKETEVKEEAEPAMVEDAAVAVAAEAN
ncbi:hypothetical protein PICMEDRAFT_71530 [Pichia membranifaciens NRRL Y-2026]|uniref:Nuclear segregation protein BFR1 n=1 Tax=Pichia membranifaciens NRRL Y-2026 TaxID=763406 RepID=A0A1E3NMX0_9ASCO|nr:hypothetical protein PICMEDRAFT_71530 [Pichia membranifaciens NRRL Y-2026]ODQ47457.1 hypothetical protein PICMEDRAFT_71530 [Pichia membranifaciens NRRL Y-2026]